METDCIDVLSEGLTRRNNRIPFLAAIPVQFTATIAACMIDLLHMVDLRGAWGAGDPHASIGVKHHA
jgi:hypothetical protein